MHRTLFPLLVASTVVYAADVDPMASAYEALYSALEQETLALESIQTATDAAGAVDQLRAALQAQQALLSTDESALWQYIDNTEGRKQALVDLLERLALQFCRLEMQQYYGSDELKTLLSPQIEFDPDVEHAKRAKLHAVDHDED